MFTLEEVIQAVESQESVKFLRPNANTARLDGVMIDW